MQPSGREDGSFKSRDLLLSLPEQEIKSRFCGTPAVIGKWLFQVIGIGYPATSSAWASFGSILMPGPIVVATVIRLI